MAGLAEEKLRAREQWGQDPCGAEYDREHELGTREFFDSVERYRYQEYAEWMPRLMEFDKFRGAKLLEIGCGKGEFIVQICELGGNHGIGIDPAYVANRSLAQSSERVLRVRCTKRVGPTCPARIKSSADAELLDQILVTRFVSAAQIIEQLAALAHHLEQSTTRGVVLDVGLEMLGKIIDALGEDRHLHFRRAGIPGLLGIRLDYFGLAAGGHRHRSSFLARGSAHQAGEVEHALGDDLATIQFGKSQKLARYRDINRAAEIGCVPSAQQDGLASLKPCRICPADGQRRDVVQRGRDGQ